MGAAFMGAAFMTAAFAFAVAHECAVGGVGVRVRWCGDGSDRRLGRGVKTGRLPRRVRWVRLGESRTKSNSRQSFFELGLGSEFRGWGAWSQLASSKLAVGGPPLPAVCHGSPFLSVLCAWRTLQVLVLAQSGGGLVISACLKYHSNVTKNFAQV